MNERSILHASAMFEAGLAVAAFLLGWLLDVDPLAALTLNFSGLAWGVLASLPMFAFFYLAMNAPWRPMRTIRNFLLETLGPYLTTCRWHDLAALAAIAGLSEELLFRGVIQPWMSQWGAGVGLIGSNVVFGLAHAITPAYALVAGGLGACMGWLLTAGDETNLLKPIVTHAVYDWLAFLYVVHVYRRTPHKTDTEHSPTSE